MNYRHDYHAGNFADVLKHAILAVIIDYLKRKEAPLMVLDAHAGPGLYDLAGTQAQKTGEWQQGIGRLWEQNCPPAFDLWLDLIKSFNPDGHLLAYPGSPKLFQSLLRPQDRLVLVEKHPEDCERLSHEFWHDPRVQVHLDDAYARLKAALPPQERRGLVLIDPPYEEKDEHHRLIKGMEAALKRWPTGIYCLWYPIKARAQIDAFWQDLTSLSLPPAVVAEIMIKQGDDPFRLNGCGLVIINPPWTLPASLQEMLPFLAQTLSPNQGSYTLQWLVPQA